MFSRPLISVLMSSIAQKHLATGWSNKRVLMQDYGFDEETADEIIEERRLEAPAIPGFGINEGDYTGNNNEEAE